MKRFSLILAMGLWIPCGSLIASPRDSVNAVYLSDGSKIVGEIIEMVPGEHLKIRTADGSEYVYSFDRIARIGRERPVSAPRDILQETYTELGVVLGPPALVNITAGRTWGKAGLRFSGMLWGNREHGLQLGVACRIAASTKSSHTIAVIGGYSKWESEALFGDFRRRYRYSFVEEWTYLGIAYDFQYSWFQLEIGPTIGSGTYSNPSLTLQLGYLHRFFAD